MSSLLAINISSSFLFVPLFVLRTTIHCGRTALDNWDWRLVSFWSQVKFCFNKVAIWSSFMTVNMLQKKKNSQNRILNFESVIRPECRIVVWLKGFKRLRVWFKHFNVVSDWWSHSMEAEMKRTKSHIILLIRLFPLQASSEHKFIMKYYSVMSSFVRNNLLRWIFCLCLLLRFCIFEIVWNCENHPVFVNDFFPFYSDFLYQNQPVAIISFAVENISLIFIIRN